MFPVPRPPTSALPPHQAPPTSAPLRPPATSSPGPWGCFVQAVSPQSVKSACPRQEPGQRGGQRLGPSDSGASSNEVFFLNAVCHIILISLPPVLRRKIIV